MSSGENGAPPRALRADQKARTRAKILQAARTLFADGGYLTCSVADLARAAGVSRAVFYLHYSDKRDLLAEVIRLSVAAQSVFLQDFPGAGDEAGLRDWIERYIQSLEQAIEGVRLVNLGSFVDPELAGAPYHEQNRVLLALAHSQPALRLVDGTGEVRQDRLAELTLLMLELGQVALSLGYGCWPTSRTLAVDLLHARFASFLREG